MSTEYYRLDVGIVWKTEAMANWAKAELDVRLAQATHLNEGHKAQETCHVTKIQNEDGNWVISAMLAYPLSGGESWARNFCKNAFDTLSSQRFHMVGDGATSTLHYHICDHEKNKRGGCVPEEKMNG